MCEIHLTDREHVFKKLFTRIGSKTESLKSKKVIDKRHGFVWREAGPHCRIKSLTKLRLIICVTLNENWRCKILSISGSVGVLLRAMGSSAWRVTNQLFYFCETNGKVRIGPVFKSLQHKTVFEWRCPKMEELKNSGKKFAQKLLKRVEKVMKI
jgi:hypothetical protein